MSDRAYNSTMFGGMGGRLAGSDMAYWLASERVDGGGVREPGKMAVCFRPEGMRVFGRSWSAGIITEMGASLGDQKGPHGPHEGGANENVTLRLDPSSERFVPCSSAYTEWAWTNESNRANRSQSQPLRPARGAVFRIPAVASSSRSLLRLIGGKVDEKSKV